MIAVVKGLLIFLVTDHVQRNRGEQPAMTADHRSRLADQENGPSESTIMLRQLEPHRLP